MARTSKLRAQYDATDANQEFCYMFSYQRQLAYYELLLYLAKYLAGIELFLRLQNSP